MNFGYDLDGTITSNPAVYGAMMRALVLANHCVTIISAVCAPNTDDAQRDKVAQLGLFQDVHYTELVLIDGGLGNPSDLERAGKAKVEAITSRQIVRYEDDRLDWAQAAAQVCDTLWLVQP